jgi:UDP-N-acetylglucosamine--N-acetylmuramyl-(pentapeptide) pyrophosphoryl-undecaprenol N-acetylglucosamine transferase
MRILFVGGGTGGHFYPLIAVAETLKTHTPNPELYYMGPNQYDEAALKEHNIRYIYCPAGKVRRYKSVKNYFDFFINFFGLFVAFFKLFALYPDVIFSKGGYTSVPILLAARLLFIPVVIHESDAVPGRANTLSMGQARYIAIAHDDVAKFFPKGRTALIGIPIRKAILQINPDPFSALGLPSDRPLIYVTGGSSGAERLNNLVIKSLENLLPRYRVFHQVGQANIDALKLTAEELVPDKSLLTNYYIQGTIPAPTVSLLMDAASVIITRAGSTTLFEIAHHGKPSIVIPIPEDVSRDQRSNAYSYARSGAAIVLEEHNMSPHLLVQEIDTIINDPIRGTAMGQAAKSLSYPEAAQKIADLLISIAHEHGSK